jgi:hypothetical protein
MGYDRGRVTLALKLVPPGLCLPCFPPGSAFAVPFPTPSFGRMAGRRLLMCCYHLWEMCVMRGISAVMTWRCWSLLSIEAVVITVSLLVVISES